MKFKQILWLYGERIAMRPYNFAHIAASFSPLPACVGEGAGGEGWMRALPCYFLNLHQRVRLVWGEGRAVVGTCYSAAADHPNPTLDAL